MNITAMERVYCHSTPCRFQFTVTWSVEKYGPKNEMSAVPPMITALFSFPFHLLLVAFMERDHQDIGHAGCMNRVDF